MKKYQIEVQEFLARVVETEAESVSDAISKIRKRYERVEIVLDYNDFVEVDFIDIYSQSKNDEKDKLIGEVINFIYSGQKDQFIQLNEHADHIFRKIERLKALLD